MEIEKFKLLLKGIADDPLQRQQAIREFQDEVWDCPEEGSQILDVLRDLAYDIDYFEADPIMRGEDPTYYGEKRLVIEIKQALQKIEEIQKKGDQ